MCVHLKCAITACKRKAKSYVKSILSLKNNIFATKQRAREISCDAVNATARLMKRKEKLSAVNETINLRASLEPIKHRSNKGANLVGVRWDFSSRGEFFIPHATICVKWKAHRKNFKLDRDGKLLVSECCPFTFLSTDVFIFRLHDLKSGPFDALCIIDFTPSNAPSNTDQSIIQLP